VKRREPSSERASSLLGRLRQVLTGPRAAEVPKQRLNDVLSSDRAILAVHASAAAQEQAAAAVQPTAPSRATAAPMFVDDDPITLEILLSELTGGDTGAAEPEAESLDVALLEAEQIGAELLDVELSQRAPLLSELELAELSPAPEPMPIEAARSEPEPVLEPVPAVAVAPPPAAPAPRSASSDDDEVYEEPIRTRSMARLLAGQGHRARALAIYDALLAVDASDASLRAEADALRRAN
jgi:hypothetical protein